MIKSQDFGKGQSKAFGQSAGISSEGSSQTKVGSVDYPVKGHHIKVLVFW